jgi:carbon monoxide dehydrogenase subunit G
MVGGLVAQVGQRLLGATAKLMMDKFFGCLREKMT